MYSSKDNMSQDEMERKTHNLFAAQGTRKQSLFAAVDTDQSGQIDANEFGKLYDLIKLEVNAELAKEAELKKDATRSKRQLKMVGVLALSLLVTLTASVLSTALTPNGEGCVLLHRPCWELVWLIAAR